MSAPPKLIELDPVFGNKNLALAGLKGRKSERFVKGTTGGAANLLLRAMTNPRRAQQSSTTDFQTQLSTATPGNFRGKQIVIINQAPKFQIANQQQDSNYQSQAVGYMPMPRPTVPCANTSGIITFSEVPGIVNIARSMGELYDGFYTIFPNTTDLPKDLTFGNVMNYAAKVLQFYAVVRTFVIQVYNNRDQILQSLAYIQNKVATLQSNQNDMLTFYMLDDKYANIRVKALRFEDKDIRFKYYFTSIEQITTNFQINAQAVFTVTSNMMNYVYMFLGLIDQIWSLGINKFNSSFLNILDKIDTVLNALSTLADIELELKNSITSTKAALENLALFRETIAENLNNVNALADQYQLAETVKQKPIWMSSGVVGAMVSLWLLLMSV